jgi:hypothetical protein
MQHFTLTLDVATLNPNQHKALIALVESLQAPYFIPTADENAGYDALVDKHCDSCDIHSKGHEYNCPMAQD